MNTFLKQNSLTLIKWSVEYQGIPKISEEYPRISEEYPRIS